MNGVVILNSVTTFILLHRQAMLEMGLGAFQTGRLRWRPLDRHPFIGILSKERSA